MKMLLAVALAASALSLAPAAVADGNCPELETCQPSPDYIPPTPSPEPPAGTPGAAQTHVVRGPFPALRKTDHRPCVSRREYYSAEGWTRAETERHWEVTGLGREVTVTGFGPAVVYPRCGYSRRHAWYGAAYRNGVLNTVLEWRDPTVAPHDLI